MMRDLCLRLLTFVLLIGTLWSDFEVGSDAIESNSGGVLFDANDDGTNDFIMNGDGNMGIGDMTPGANLYVAGNVTVTGNITLGGTTGVTEVLLGDGSAASPSLAFASDPDTGFFLNGTGNLALATAGTLRMVIDGSGNLGLGTSDPVDLFHLATTSSNLIFASDGSLSVGDIANKNERFGLGAVATGGNSTAMGVSASATGANSVAIGKSANASADNTVAIGKSAAASAASATAVGVSANASVANTIAFGRSSVASAGNVIAVGRIATASAENAIAIGESVTASGNDSIVIGEGSTSAFERVISIGRVATAGADDAIAIGYVAVCTIEQGLAFGYDAVCNGADSIAFGQATEISGSVESIALGRSITITGNGVVAIGENVAGAAGNSIVVANSGSAAGNSISMGYIAVSAGNGIAASASTTVNHESIVLSGGGSSTKDGELHIGSGTSRIDTLYFGEGVTSTSPSEVTLQATGSSGTDIAGGNLMVASGNGTGTGAGGKFQFQTAAAAGSSGSSLNSLSDRVILDVNGNLGIGDTAPSQVVSVMGNVVPSVHQTYNMGSLSLAWNNVYVDDLVIVSDQRLKENVKPLSSSSALVDDLRPVSYKLHTQRGVSRRYGLIAQEVRGVDEKLVDVGDGRSRMGVHYADLVPHLVKVVQEQQDVIDSLEEGRVSSGERILKMRKLIEREERDFRKFEEKAVWRMRRLRLSLGKWEVVDE